MSMNSKTFLLVGNGPYANRGCEAIVRGTVDILAERYPRARFILSSLGGEPCMTDAATETDDRIRHEPHRDGWKRFSKDWLLFRVLHRRSALWQASFAYRAEFIGAQHCDCALQIGGDNYTLDYGKPLPHMQIDQAIRSVGTPLVLWGASVGPFTSDPDFESVMRDHLSLFDLILARESETVAYLASIGVEERVRLVADPAFALKPKQPVCSEELMRFLGTRPVGLNLSPLIGNYTDDGGASWTALAKACIEALLSADVGPVLLIPHVTLEGHDDYVFLKELYDSINSPADRLMVAPPCLTAAEYKWVISKLSMFAGSRTHATIAALSSEVPTVSIGYSMKCRGINKDIFGSQQWVIPVRDMTPSVILSKVRELAAAESGVRGQLASAIPNMVANAKSSAMHVSELLERRPKG